MGAKEAAMSIAPFLPHAIFRKREPDCVAPMARTGAEL